MSDTGFFPYGSKSAPLPIGNQRPKTSTSYPKMLPRTTTAYPHSSVMRKALPESEPLSEFTEGPMSLTMLPAPFRQIQVSTSPGQIQSSTYPLVIRSQRAVHQEIRSNPYNHPANAQLHTIQPQLLLPSASSNSFSTNYNLDQSFIMHSTTPPGTKRGVFAIEEKGTSPAFNSSPKAKTNNSTGKSPTQGLKINKLSSVNRRRFFVGTIDQLVRWHKMAKQVQLCTIYEVSAVLESISCSHSGVNRMILRNEQKNCAQLLQAVYFPIDRNLPKAKAGDLVTCIGRMVGTNKLQVYDMWLNTPESLAGMKRISFLCQRTLQEANLNNPEP